MTYTASHKSKVKYKIVIFLHLQVVTNLLNCAPSCIVIELFILADVFSAPIVDSEQGSF